MRQRKGVLLQVDEDVPTRVVLLLVGEAQVAHILAEDFDAVSVFATRRGAAHLFNT